MRKMLRKTMRLVKGRGSHLLPDGSKTCYESFSTGNVQFVMSTMNAGGGGKTQLTTGASTDDFAPDWGVLPG